MGAFSSICCSGINISFADKLVNLLVGSTLNLKQLGEPGVSEEERAKRLTAVRAAGIQATNPAYEKTVQKAGWKVQEDEVGPASDGTMVRIRLHTPASGETGLPLVIWSHGGGMVIMNYKDDYGASLFHAAQGSDAKKEIGPKFAWVLVDYRLAPETKYPLPVEDVLAVYKAFCDPGRAARCGYDVNRIGLAGVSAGAFLTAHAVSRLGKGGFQPAPKFMALLYPMADPSQDSESTKRFGELEMCPSVWIRWCWQSLLVEWNEARQREASAVTADWAGLKGLRTLSLTGFCDYLHDEGVALGDAQEAAGLKMARLESQTSHACYILDSKAKESLEAWFTETLSPTT